MFLHLLVIYCPFLGLLSWSIAGYLILVICFSFCLFLQHFLQHLCNVHTFNVIHSSNPAYKNQSPNHEINTIQVSHSSIEVVDNRTELNYNPILQTSINCPHHDAHFFSNHSQINQESPPVANEFIAIVS